ncbi:MAG: A24 family peptidase [Desulfoplanes sp.]|nr:A24 family peptidase [Desulfoplanes sp.]
MDTHFSTFLLTAVFAAALCDVIQQKIPNSLNLGLVVCSIGYHTLHAGIPGFIFSLSGMAVGIVVLFIPFAMGGMGAGDVKLMGAVGAALGPRGAFISFMYIALLGGVWALYLLITKDRKALGRLVTDLKAVFLTRSIAFMPTPIQRKNAPRICYGVAIALGTMLYVSLDFFGRQILTLQ